ncbi:MAG: twin-arginine translocase TatA/TatE family subunit [Deltaproteobacteria bacterium]|nr:twin-arginine translocase TatA/TatE family subunit [Deltaproteobacteria bacterium]
MTHILLGIAGLGTAELIVVLLMILIIFGVGKLPEIGSGLGKGIRNFKKNMQGGGEEEKDDNPDTKDQNNKSS